jgi:hypothetical protein
LIIGVVDLDIGLVAHINSGSYRGEAETEGFRSIVNQKNSYGCEQESQDLI